MGARCYGLYTNLNGKQAETGLCELTDLDGDKWWMDYHGNADGAGGTYTAAGGTGKYDGMTLRGEYRLDNAWGSPAKEVAFLGATRTRVPTSSNSRPFLAPATGASDSRWTERTAFEPVSPAWGPCQDREKRLDRKDQRAAPVRGRGAGALVPVSR